MRRDWGRHLLGLCSVMFGALTIASREWGGFTFAANASLIVPYLAALAYIAAGIFIQVPKLTRFGAALMSAGFLLSAVLYAVTMAIRIHEPGIWDGLFERLGIFSAAFIVYERTGATPDVRLLRSAIILFGVCVISYTMAQAVFLNATADLVPKWIPPGQMFWALLTTVAFALAAIALITGRMALLAAELLTLMILIFGITIWIPAAVAKPGSLFVWSEFTWNFAIAAAAWIVAECLGSRVRLSQTSAA